MYVDATYKQFMWIEWVLVLIFGLNALYHIVSYVVGTFNMRPVVLNPEQKKLLGITNDETLFKSTPLTSEIKSCLPEPISPIINMTTPLNLSRRSLGAGLNETSEYFLTQVYQ